MIPGMSLRISRTVRRLAILILMLTVAGCGRMSDVEARADYWQLETADFIRGRVTLDELHTWLRERGAVYAFSDSDVVNGVWVITVERVYPESLRCKFIDIVLSVQLDESQVIQHFYYNFDGACWW